MMTERWFMRYVGAAFIVVGVISFFSRILNNPDGDWLISLLNFAIAITFVIGGFWAIWTSYDDEQMHNMMDNLREQSPNRSLVFAAIQLITGLLFLIGGGLSWRLLGILLLTSSLWFVRRSMQLRHFQE